MDLFVIRGGKPLCGRVAVSGSKNATLPIMAASIMVDGEVTLEGVPDLADVITLSQVLQTLGMSVSRLSETAHRVAGPKSRRAWPRSERSLCEATDYSPLVPATLSKPLVSIHVDDASQCVASYELVRRMRASICVLGPLLAKRGRAVVSLPGGCNIGDRPIDVHLRGLAGLGAELRLERGYVVGVAKRLKGAVIDLAGPRGSTVTGTANLLMAATLAKGRTVLRHAACEPEVDDLARFLCAAGATIDGVGTDTLEITGVESLTAVTHRVIPDRIEAATLMMAAAITGGDLVVAGVAEEHLRVVFDGLNAAGVICESVTPTDGSGYDAFRIRTQGPLVPVDVIAGPYPGFPTDLQAQWTALMTLAAGRSSVRDDVFPDRFRHLPELARLGAHVSRSGSTALIQGGHSLRGTNLMASDLRASAALVLAALAAEGESVIRRIYHLDRGYERLDAKLRSLGADVTRRTDQAEVAVLPPLPAA